MTQIQATRIRMTCPDCGRRTSVRSSRAEALLSRYMVLACDDAENCGATFSARLEITHRIMPGLKPNPDVHLRTAPPRRRGPANDNLPGRQTLAPCASEVAPLSAANDDDGCGEAVAFGG